MIDDPDLRRLFEAESAEHLARLDDGLLRIEKTPADAALLEETFREAHSLKGAARMLGLSRIEGTAHGLEGMLNAAKKGEAPLTPEAVERLNAALAELRRHVSEALAGEPAAAAPEPAAVPPLPASDEAPPAEVPLQETPPAEFRIETVRVETRRLDELLTQAGELAVVRGRVQHRRALMDELLDQWTAIGRRGEDDVGARQRFGRLLKQARDALADDGARLATTAGLIEERVRGMRLLPLSTLFALFPRMVRDLAKTQGKVVELAIEGGDIAVDKRILEDMKDPLMHLLRNAVDHGIEPPDERERLGKPRAGRVRLAAVREDAGVRLAVVDDGRGLDADRIRQEAEKRGLLDPAAPASAEQLQQLVFAPGFSTCGYVTELSGRGVGLDVVRINVERMKGNVRLESQTGCGLAVELRLPLSLATTRLLLVAAGGRLCGLPVEHVLTSRRVRREEIFTLEGRAAVRVAGEPTLVARLADLLELPAVADAEIMACVVLLIGEERLGLLVDDLPGEEEVVSRPLGAPLARVRNVAALAMLAGGEVCVVLNPVDLLRSAHKAGARLPARAAATASRRGAVRPAVLLVEDSALIRAMEKRVIEDGGYEVTTAVDGVDALNRLGGRSFAAVVSDIVMPNLDGLALTARIRAEPRYRELPVILVTTLASDEDKRRGLEAGANAYIPKPAFDQRVLLDTLNRLVAS